MKKIWEWVSPSASLEFWYSPTQPTLLFNVSSSSSSIYKIKILSSTSFSDYQIEFLFCLIADRTLLKITEDEFTGPPFNVIFISLSPSLPLWLLYLYRCVVFMDLGFCWVMAGGGWVAFRVDFLHVGRTYCSWEVSLHTPLFWREQVFFFSVLKRSNSINWSWNLWFACASKFDNGKTS